MPTISQLVRKGRKKKLGKVRATAMRRIFNPRTRRFTILPSP
ncbi:30S ribosomal protein S12, partial [Candidatus Gottesmanbacteria bacterium]|nr:30S ribosomal protein S12 [Candidatus Gottesmanbacteria bacterium]